jgi:hypothetical protein
MTPADDSLPEAWQRRLFWAGLAGSLVLMAVFNATGAPLNTPTAPFGIVSFELAGTPERAGAILASWDAGARERAAFGLGLDYLFMPLYAAAISTACLWAGRVLQGRRFPLARLGAGLAAAVWLAAGLDALENLALARLLFAGPAPAWPQAAWACAAVKFALIFLGLVYAFLGAAVRFLPVQERQSRGI